MLVIDLLGLIFIPAAIAAGVGVGWHFIFTSAARYSLAIALAAGLAAGCWIYPDRLPFTPERHWQWTPYLGFLAAILGSIAAFPTLPRWERLLLHLPLCGAAAMFLVPTWDNLQPSRPILILLLAAYFTLLITALAYLPERLRGRGFLFLLMLAASGVAVLVMSEISLRLGEVSLRVATALGGCWAASWLFRFPDKEGESHWPLLTAALIPVYVILSGGSLFAAAIDPSPPKYLLLVAPAAPLTLWLFAWGPLSRFQGVTAIVVQSILVLSVPAILLAIAWLNSEPADEWSRLESKAGLVRSESRESPLGIAFESRGAETKQN